MPMPALLPQHLGLPLADWPRAGAAGGGGSLLTPGLLHSITDPAQSTHPWPAASPSQLGRAHGGSIGKGEGRTQLEEFSAP